MHGAVFALAVNIAVATLFATSFAIIALTNPTHRSVYGFSQSYAIGTVTPLSELLLPLSRWPEPFMISSYFCFMAGLLAMSAALSRFYGKRAPWGAIAGIFCGAVVMRWLLWGGERNTMPYELLFQLPFVAASAMPAWVLFRQSPRRPLEIATGITFGIVALHFLAKPFLAVAFGSGRSASEYIASTYALMSQASTGILLTAAGLMILLITLQSIVRESQVASETDPLSGLANRRGFDLRAGQALERAKGSKLPVSVATFDIDHFKSINDTYGHPVGDQVIRGLAWLLKGRLRATDLIGRYGGEEFIVALPGADTEVARTVIDRIRGDFAVLPHAHSGGSLYATFSAGISVYPEISAASALTEAADGALLNAKRLGRNRVELAFA